MLVRYFMSEQIVTLPPDTTCQDALRKLREKSIRRAPVVRDGRLVGMISERDLLRVLPGTIRQIDTRAGAEAEDMRVGLIMTSNVVTLGPDEHIDDAAKKMLSRRIGGMPVVSDGAVVGMLTESDLFRAFVRMASASDVLRIRIWRAKHRELAPDPVMLATRLGFKVRGFLMHEKPGGEEFAVLRVQGTEKERLLELLGCSGYTVVEVTDLRDPSTHKPAA